MPAPPRIVLLSGHCATHYCARSHALGHACLSQNDRAVAYRDVLLRADLAGNHATTPDFRAARKAGLRGYYCVFAKLAVVADLYEIVELDAAPQHRVFKAA